MCVAPISHNGRTFACRKCWQCRENKVSDWVGRCIAETKTARHTHVVTLTYGRDESGSANHLRAAVLTYSDVQKYFKLLRYHGYRFRYLVVGEYGSTKGRAHWHAILFWEEKVPDRKLDKMITDPYWPHGHTVWDDADEKSIRYACKYLQKDLDEAGSQAHFSLSKKPPLGDRYFRELAGRYVAQGLSPQSAIYHFPEVLAKGGKPRKFYMHGVTADNFCAAFIARWHRDRTGDWPQSDFIDEYLDKVAGAPEVFQLPEKREVMEKPWLGTPGGVPVRFSEKHNAYYCEADGGQLFWSFDEKGNRAWQSVIRGAPKGLRPSDRFDRHQASEELQQEVARRTAR